MLRFSIVFGGMAAMAALGALAPADAQTVMQQCGQQYQAAKAAGTLNGLTWNQFRTDCAAKLKATPASTAPAPATPPPAKENPLNPGTTTAAAPAAPPAPTAPGTVTPSPKTAGAPVSAGRAAMLTRERQCGEEWRTQKVTLIAQTPGLTWPKYWHLCNTRLKAAGQ